MTIPRELSKVANLSEDLRAHRLETVEPAVQSLDKVAGDDPLRRDFAGDLVELRSDFVPQFSELGAEFAAHRSMSGLSPKKTLQPTGWQLGSPFDSAAGKTLPAPK
jgi:hypothetical protein